MIPSHRFVVGGEVIVVVGAAVVRAGGLPVRGVLARVEEGLRDAGRAVRVRQGHPARQGVYGAHSGYLQMLCLRGMFIRRQQNFQD